jgi:hypothetical protein
MPSGPCWAESSYFRRASPPIPNLDPLLLDSESKESTTRENSAEAAISMGYVGHNESDNFVAIPSCPHIFKGLPQKPVLLNAFLIAMNVLPWSRMSDIFWALSGTLRAVSSL